MGWTQVEKDGTIAVVPFNDGTGLTTGAELRQYAGIPNDRQVTVTDEHGTHHVPDHQQVQLHPGMRVSDIPHFEYGNTLPVYWGSEPTIVTRLRIECSYLTRMYQQSQPCTFGHDSDINRGGEQRIGRWWVMIPQLHLPRGLWSVQSTPILITIPDQYPQVPPDGFWLMENLRDSNGNTPGHYFEYNIARGAELANKGWAWFCIHPQGWQCYADITMGDSVYKYLNLIHLVLSKNH